MEYESDSEEEEEEEEVESNAAARQTQQKQSKGGIFSLFKYVIVYSKLAQGTHHFDYSST